MQVRVARGAARRVARVGLIALVAAAPAGCGFAKRDTHASGPRDDAGYWAFADRMQERLDDLWSEADGYYRAGTGGAEPMVNANLLLTHAVAAMRGHEGPARQDDRARRLARRLLATPPFVTEAPPAGGGSQVHAPGFVSSMTNPRANQHLVYDADVVEGLAYAWRARRELRLPTDTVRLIEQRLRAIAHGRYWRWPAMRLNQINWYALVYSAAATVTGERDLLTHDMRLQLRRFFSRATRNFGSGMRFHYLPQRPAAHPMNVDSAEYANIVLSFARFYRPAVGAGMPPLTASHRRLAREWVSRAVAGYWTHGGYVNWDSGLGFARWHETKKLALAQQGLIGIASAPSLQPGPRYGAWAKHLLDRGFDLFERLADRAHGLPGPILFGVVQKRQKVGSARLAAARMEGNAARAIAAGLGRRRAAEPPAMYSFDPDIGRLAVTTPAYNTAIVAVNQRAFSYGGIELARLYDGDQEVAANIGGRPPASFGVLVRDIRGHRVAATQLARPSTSRSSTPLRLTRAPAGAGATSAAGTGRAFAGAFRDLRATGTLRSGPLWIRTAHRFTPRFIETRWTIRRAPGAARHSVDVLFPSWGPGAKAVAVLRDGRRVRVVSRRSLDDVAYFHVMSKHSGYVVKPLMRPAGATVHAVRPRRQFSAPQPGPTLAIQLVRAARSGGARFAVRLAPVKDAEEAAAVARRW